MLMDLTCMNFHSYFQFSPGTRTRDDLQISTLNPMIRHAFYDSFYLNRVAMFWNGLKYETRLALLDCETICQIKPLIKEYLCQFFHENFDSEMKCSWYFICTCTNCKQT